ncbi:MAG: hypothetical protein JKY84_14625 [Emcibacteraceae bacterium]|nr:hypothetical protein [Emcibacteraceae bacterium]
MKMSYFILFIFSLGTLFSCAQEDIKNDDAILADVVLPDVMPEIIKFFDATIFADKNNKIEYIPEPDGERAGISFHLITVDRLGSFAPKLVGYMGFAQRYFSSEILNRIRISTEPGQVSDVQIFGIKELNPETIEEAYSKYKEFVRTEVPIEKSEFEKTDFTQSCFIQRIMTAGKRRTFSAILYNGDDTENYDIKERVVDCYFRTFFVQFGVWPFETSNRKFLTVPTVVYPGLEPGMGSKKDILEVMERIRNQKNIPIDEKVPTFALRSTGFQGFLVNDDVYVGMGRDEFFQMIKDRYSR